MPCALFGCCQTARLFSALLLTIRHIRDQDGDEVGRPRRFGLTVIKKRI
jgi:hypothetical protein